MKRKKKRFTMFGSIFVGLAIAACLYIGWDFFHYIEDSPLPLVPFDLSIDRPGPDTGLCSGLQKEITYEITVCL